MKNLKFNTHFSLWGIDIHLHANNPELFALAVDYFHHPDNDHKNVKDKRIDFYFKQKKMSSSRCWDLDNWGKQIYIFESWSRDIRVKLNYQKGIIKSYLSSESKLSKETIEDLLIFRPLRLVLSRYGFYVMHAGCVVKDNKGILIPGSYGGGKTITTLNLMRKGFKFLGDEYILLKESNDKIKAYTFPQKIGIKKNLLNLFPELKFLQQRKDSPRQKKRFWVDEVYPQITAQVCYPQLMLFPHFKGNGRLNLVPTSKHEALLNLLKDKENFSIPHGSIFKDIALKQFNILSSLLRQVDTNHLVYSHHNIYRLAGILKEQSSTHNVLSTK